MLSFHGVSHRYRAGPPALDQVSLTLATGITGLVGVNGAGKTTLIRVAAGALAPWQGQVSVDGADLYPGRRRLAARHGAGLGTGGSAQPRRAEPGDSPGPGGPRQARSRVAWMPQSGNLPRGLTALELVSYLTWMRGRSWAEARRRAQQALEQVELGEQATTRVERLSGGMQRRVWLAQALAADAEVLLLDEPSTGLDPRQRATMVRLLGQVTDRVVLLSSHILEDVAELADRVLVLDQGRVRYDGDRPPRLDAAWFAEQTGSRP